MTATPCQNCGLVHPAAEPVPALPQSCIDLMRKNMASLLLRIGTLDKCRGCGTGLYWIRHLNGKNVPYTPAGLNHFIDCPERERFEGKPGR